MTNYPGVGRTHPADELWTDPPSGFRVHESTVGLGQGDPLWEAVCAAVLEWGVKTRSGFTVEPPDRVRTGRDYTLIVHLGPLAIREPVHVVAVVEGPDRCGFAYGTREGHPVRGEEAFVVHRNADGRVFLTLRSLTRAPRGLWLFAYPGALIAQRLYRRRYQRALLNLDA